MVARLVAYESWDDTSETEAPRSSVSAIGLIAVLIPMPVYAVVLRRPGEHLAGVLHRLPRKVSDVDPLRAAPAHDERADVVLLVDDDQGPFPRLVKQRVDVLLAVVQPAADPDGAVRIQPYCPVE
jgi:hypothetical protein